MWKIMALNFFKNEWLIHYFNGRFKFWKVFKIISHGVPINRHKILSVLKSKLNAIMTPMQHVKQRNFTTKNCIENKNRFFSAMSSNNERKLLWVQIMSENCLLIGKRFTVELNWYNGRYRYYASSAPNYKLVPY